jgi:hypothetical protein
VRGCVREEVCDRERREEREGQSLGLGETGCVREWGVDMRTEGAVARAGAQAHGGCRDGESIGGRRDGDDDTLAR